MSALSTLKKARTVEELANEIEPMAQALASLADQTSEHLNEQQRMSKEHNEQWMQTEMATSRAWKETAAEVREAASKLIIANNNIVSMANHMQLKMIMISLMVSMIPIAVLLIASLILLDSQIVENEGVTWMLIHLKG